MTSAQSSTVRPYSIRDFSDGLSPDAPGEDPTDWFSAKDKILQDLGALKGNEIGQFGRKLCSKEREDCDEESWRCPRLGGHAD